MFNNAYKDNFAVFALIFGNIFPQNNIGLNPIICEMFLHFNILATAKFTGISVYYSTGMCLQIYFHFNISVLREFQLFLVEFFDSVNKPTGELSHTLIYLQYLKATAKFPLVLYEGVNNNYTVRIQLAVYSCIPNVIFSYTRTCSNFSLNIR